MSTTTVNYHWGMPTVGGDATVWGGTINATIVAIDAALKTTDTNVAANTAAAAANTTDIGNLKVIAPAPNHLVLTTTRPPTVNPNFSAIDGTINGQLRWVILNVNADAEASGDVGSNFQIDSYTNGGSYKATPLKIIRSTGSVLVNGVPVSSLMDRLSALEARVAALGG